MDGSDGQNSRGYSAEISVTLGEAAEDLEVGRCGPRMNQSMSRIRSMCRISSSLCVSTIEMKAHWVSIRVG